MTLILMFFLTLAAFTVRVVTGFGSAIFLAPIFSNILPPKEAVVLIILLESFINIIFVLKERLMFSLKEVYGGAFAGILVGILLFGWASQEVIGVLIGISMALLALIMLLGVDLRVRDTGSMFFGLGFLSGAMGVLTGVNGPQIILGLTSQGYSAMFIRGFMITYLIVIDTITLLAFILSGHVTAVVLTKFLFLAPSVAIAYYAGRKILGRLDGEMLRKIMLTLVLMLSFVVMFKYGGGLID